MVILDLESPFFFYCKHSPRISDKKVIFFDLKKPCVYQIKCKHLEKKAKVKS